MSFYYRKAGEENFKQLSAISKTNGSFGLNLELSKEDQPQWIVSYQYDHNDYGILRSNTFENKYPYKYEYYIVLDDGSCILSSEVDSNLKKIIQVYSSIEADLFLKAKIPCVKELSWGDGEIIPEKIVLEIYDHNKLTKEELQIADSSVAWEPDNISFDKLIIKAQYDNGKIFGKEIWDFKSSY